MNFQPLSLPGLVLLTPKVFEDERGFFMETFRQEVFEAECGAYHFVQDNHSRSTRGVLRGLHYQLHKPQGKLVRVTRGEVFDVAVDMRQNSPTYGQWEAVVLSEENKQLLWIPPGFAHGFYVTSEIAELQYRCTDYYAPEDEYVVHWQDPDLAIQWPALPKEDGISAKDAKGLAFKNAPCFQ